MFVNYLKVSMRTSSSRVVGAPSDECRSPLPALVSSRIIAASRGSDGRLIRSWVFPFGTPEDSLLGYSDARDSAEAMLVELASSRKRGFLSQWLVPPVTGIPRIGEASPVEVALDPESSEVES